jgi:hypothetical protein
MDSPLSRRGIGGRRGVHDVRERDGVCCHRHNATVLTATTGRISGFNLRSTTESGFLSASYLNQILKRGDRFENFLKAEPTALAAGAVPHTNSNSFTSANVFGSIPMNVPAPGVETVIAVLLTSTKGMKLTPSALA